MDENKGNNRQEMSDHLDAAHLESKIIEFTF